MKIDVTEIENFGNVSKIYYYFWMRRNIRKNLTNVNFNERKTAIMHNKGISNIYYNWQNK